MSNPANLSAALFLALATIVVAAKIAGALARRLGQPEVIGEIFAGIALGPSLLGLLAPRLQDFLFAPESVPILGAVGNIGLALYLVAIGGQVDAAPLRRHGRNVALIAAAGIAVPFGLGLGLAFAIRDEAPSAAPFGAFAVFLGVVLAVTALPVLARILEEHGLLRHHIGGTAMSCALLADIVAWVLLGASVAWASREGAGPTALTLVTVLVVVSVLLGISRPLIRWFDAGSRPSAQSGVASLFAILFLVSWALEQAGLTFVVGAFALGLLVPRGGTRDRATRSSHGLVISVLLPIYFAYTGLRADLTLIASLDLLLLVAGFTVAAFLSKGVTTLLAARLAGFQWRSSALLGLLLNARGLTELIVLNVGLDVGLLSPTLFAALIPMTIVTTVAPGFGLRRLRPADAPAPTRSPLVGLDTSPPR